MSTRKEKEFFRKLKILLDKYGVNYLGSTSYNSPLTVTFWKNPNYRYYDFKYEGDGKLKVYKRESYTIK